MAFICQAGRPEIGSTPPASFYVSPSEVCHQKKSIITKDAKEMNETKGNRLEKEHNLMSCNYDSRLAVDS